MTEWKGALAVVNEVSTTLGSTLIKSLLNTGMKVIGMSSSKEILNELKRKFKICRNGSFYRCKVDVTNKDEVNKAFQKIEDLYGEVAIFINCVEVATIRNLAPSKTTRWRRLFNSKLNCLWLTTSKATDVMRQNNRNGHIFDISCMEPESLVHTSKKIKLENEANFKITAVTRLIAMTIGENSKQPHVLYSTNIRIWTNQTDTASLCQLYREDREELKNMVSIFTINSIEELIECIKVLLVKNVKEGSVVEYSANQVEEIIKARFPPSTDK